MEKNRLFAETMIGWWENYRRDLPWRKTDNPYTILVTEILLRKTSAGHLKKIYKEFFRKYPSVDDLARANYTELKNIIKPLGLANNRSKQLISMANKVKTDYKGKIPIKCNELLSLPGVGRYASSGVRCIAYKKDEAMVDINVIKIVKRYFGYKSKKKRADNDIELWKFVKLLIPPGKCKEFNLGLIDFVNAVCTSNNPKCEKCILNKKCNFNV